MKHAAKKIGTPYTTLPSLKLTLHPKIGGWKMNFVLLGAKSLFSAAFASFGDGILPSFKVTRFNSAGPVEVLCYAVLSVFPVCASCAWLPFLGPPPNAQSWTFVGSYQEEGDSTRNPTVSPRIMEVQAISFLSFRLIFHWTMIVGERIEL